MDESFQEKPSGFVVITRDLAYHKVWTRESFSGGQAWVDLLMLANNRQCEYVRRDGVAVAMERGQCSWGIRALGDRWRWGKDKVRSFLRWLEKEEMIRWEQGENVSKITIVNYDFWQAAGGRFQTQNQTATRHPADSDQTATRPEREKERESSRTLEDSVPTETEVLEVAAAYPGDPARGIPDTLPDGWVLRWFNYRSRPGQPPFGSRERWTAELYRQARADWASQRLRPEDWGQKMAQKSAGRLNGTETVPQRRFRLEREREELDAHFRALRQVGADWRGVEAQLEAVELELDSLEAEVAR